MSELRPYQRDLIARAQGAFGQGARAGGLWRDPADGSTRTEAHALRLVGKDAGEVRT